MTLHVKKQNNQPVKLLKIIIKIELQVKIIHIHIYSNLNDLSQYELIFLLTSFICSSVKIGNLSFTSKQSLLEFGPALSTFHYIQMIDLQIQYISRF